MTTELEYNTIDNLLVLFNDDNTDSLFSEDTNKLMTNWQDYGFIKKDVLDGELLKINNFSFIDNKRFNVVCDNGLTFPCYFKKEENFFKYNEIDFVDFDDLGKWFSTEDCREWIKENEFTIKVNYSATNKKNIVGSLVDGYTEALVEELMEEIKTPTKVYTVMITGRNKGGFIASLDGLVSFIPGTLASATKIDDFDSFIGKEIDVMVEDYLKESNMFVLSNRKYVNTLMPDLVKNLDLYDTYGGKITGITEFGIFIKFNDILSGLLHQTEMDEETLVKFNNKEYKVDDDINFYIKKIENNFKIILTQRKIAKEDIITIEDFQKRYEGKWIEGIIINVRDFGTFVKFDIDDNNSFTGLLHRNSYTNDFYPNVNDKVNVYVFKVDINTNKIYLNLRMNYNNTNAG